MTAELLVDSGFLYALLDTNDRYHAAVRAVREMEMETAIVPDIVLVEVAFLARGSGGVPAVIKLLTAFERLSFPLTPITMADLARAKEKLQTYSDARFDFVDCCLMALAEWLNITQVCTIDRKDFLIFRPAHCPYLDLLPRRLSAS